MPNDLVSRSAAKQAVHDTVVSGSTVVRIWDAIDKLPAVKAIPLEWLREKIKEHTDEEGWQDYLANSFGLCIEEWQKEQEAQDGK